MLYSRDLIKELIPFIKRKEFVAVIGPRQSGKTTLFHLLREYLVKQQQVKEDAIRLVTFEDRQLLAQFETDPLAFVQTYLPAHSRQVFYLLIDEFQYVQNGGQKLKLIYDTLDNLKIIITGSSSLDIKAQVGRYMVGRIFTFYLFPFNFGEYLEAADKRIEKIYRAKNTESVRPIFNGNKPKIKEGVDIFSGEFIRWFEEFAVWGGYPAVVLTKNRNEKLKVLNDIYNNYVLKDVKTLLQLATENNLFRLSQYLATQIGNIVVYQNLGQAAGLDFRNLKKHLNILKETFVCRAVRPFFRNRQKELAKNPKIFFLDTGFRNNLIEDIKKIEKRPDAGALIENTVFIRLNSLVNREEGIKFWRTKAGAEVDFVLNVSGEILPIEVKYSFFNQPKVSKSFASFVDNFSPPRGIILNKNYWGMVRRGKTRIYFIPVYYL